MTAPKKAADAAAAFQASLSDALHLGADAFWQADETGVIRRILALGDEVPSNLLNVLENKPLASLVGTTAHAAFRDIRVEVRPIGGDPVVMSLSGRRSEEGCWHGIARFNPRQGAALTDRQTRSVLDQLRESRDRELVLREETETLLDGLRILTTGQTSHEMFSALLDRLAPALEFQAALILQRSWSGTISVSATMVPLGASDIQTLGEHLLASEEVTTLLQPVQIALIDVSAQGCWESGLSIKLRSGSKSTILLCLHKQRGFFAARHIGLGTRLSLLASQAFQIEEERQGVLESSKLAAVGEMAAGIVHEINQPLTAMALGLSNMKAALEVGSFDKDRATEKIARLEGQVQRIAKIISSMKVLARRSDGQHAPFVLREAVTDALAIIEHKLKQRGIETVIEVPQMLSASGDLGECTQLVLNLLSNAHDAIEAQASKESPPRGGRITVTASAPDSDWLELAVSDTGGGFPASALEKALLPFYTTKAAGKGTGLGLALCRRIAENMGGSISLANGETGALIRLRLRRSEI
jgi:signal transduction histidine kinase